MPWGREVTDRDSRAKGDTQMGYCKLCVGGVVWDGRGQAHPSLSISRLFSLSLFTIGLC